jgi:sensor histidine kinase YesM
MVATMLPLSVLFSIFLFGNHYFADLTVFLVATVTLFFITGVAFFAYGYVAIILRARFPHEHQLNSRLIISIMIFILMSGVLLSLLFRGLDAVNFLGYQYNEGDFQKSFIALIVTNVFLTFLEEGVSRFEKYKQNVRETEHLKKEYMQGQLLGLKSQVNPHFLFNSLNSLSSLITESPDKAEVFLNELSKVYRYLLKNNNEQLITLKTEISFIHSYFYLLKERYGEGIQLQITVPAEAEELMLPPLTLQIIFESILSQNTIAKSQPLKITIEFEEPALLEIKNNSQPRINIFDFSEKGLENIANKYLLLGQQPVRVVNQSKQRIIRLPLILNPQTLIA